MTLKLSAGDTLNWTRSSYSSNDGPECVEVAATRGAVQVRDSKDVGGARLAFTTAGWAAFAAYAAGLADATR